MIVLIHSLEKVMPILDINLLRFLVPIYIPGVII